MGHKMAEVIGTTEDQHDRGTEDASSIEQKETNAKIKEAFELAAQQLGFKIGFSGSYVYIDEECDSDTKDAIAVQKAECEAEPSPGTSTPSEPPADAPENPKLDDIIPGTRFRYKEIVKSATCTGDKQRRLDTMDKTHLANAVKAFQGLEKYLQSSSVTGTVTSAYRCGNIGNSNSNHMQGHAIDFQPNGSPKNAFIKVMDMLKSGALSGNQFIYELRPGSREAGAIIHFDFGPATSAKTGALVGGQGVGSPYYSVTDTASLEAAITKRLADF